MNYIQIVFTLAVSVLIAAPSSAANPTRAELTLQSQQRLTKMREALGLDENHSFQMRTPAAGCTGANAHTFPTVLPRHSHLGR